MHFVRSLFGSPPPAEPLPPPRSGANNPLQQAEHALEVACESLKKPQGRQQEVSTAFQQALKAYFDAQPSTSTITAFAEASHRDQFLAKLNTSLQQADRDIPNIQEIRNLVQFAATVAEINLRQAAALENKRLQGERLGRENPYLKDTYRDCFRAVSGNGTAQLHRKLLAQSWEACNHLNLLSDQRKAYQALLNPQLSAEQREMYQAVLTSQPSNPRPPSPFHIPVATPKVPSPRHPSSVAPKKSPTSQPPPPSGSSASVRPPPSRPSRIAIDPSISTLDSDIAKEMTKVGPIRLETVQHFASALHHCFSQPGYPHNFPTDVDRDHLILNMMIVAMRLPPEIQEQFKNTAEFSFLSAQALSILSTMAYDVVSKGSSSGLFPFLESVYGFNPTYSAQPLLQMVRFFNHPNNTSSHTTVMDLHQFLKHSHTLLTRQQIRVRELSTASSRTTINEMNGGNLQELIEVAEAVYAATPSIEILGKPEDLSEEWRKQFTQDPYGTIEHEIRSLDTLIKNPKPGEDLQLLARTRILYYMMQAAPGIHQKRSPMQVHPRHQQLETTLVAFIRNIRNTDRLPTLLKYYSERVTQIQDSVDSFDSTVRAKRNIDNILNSATKACGGRAGVYSNGVILGVPNNISEDLTALFMQADRSKARLDQLAFTFATSAASKEELADYGQANLPGLNLSRPPQLDVTASTNTCACNAAYALYFGMWANHYAKEWSSTPNQATENTKNAWASNASNLELLIHLGTSRFQKIQPNGERSLLEIHQVMGKTGFQGILKRTANHVHPLQTRLHPGREKEGYIELLKALSVDVPCDPEDVNQLGAIFFQDNHYIAINMLRTGPEEFSITITDSLGSQWNDLKAFQYTFDSINTAAAFLAAHCPNMHGNNQAYLYPVELADVPTGDAKRRLEEDVAYLRRTEKAIEDAEQRRPPVQTRPVQTRRSRRTERKKL